jgi:hypothetical protein
LAVTATWTKKVSEFTMLSAEALGCLMALEALHTSDPALDAAVVRKRLPIDAVDIALCRR